MYSISVTWTHTDQPTSTPHMHCIWPDPTEMHTYVPLKPHQQAIIITPSVAAPTPTNAIPTPIAQLAPQLLQLLPPLLQLTPAIPTPFVANPPPPSQETHPPSALGTPTPITGNSPFFSTGDTRMALPTINCWSIPYVLLSEGNSKNRGRMTVAEGVSPATTGWCALKKSV